MTAEDLLIYAKALSAGEIFQNPDTLQEMLTFNPNGMDGLMPYGLGLMDFSQIGAPGSWGHEGQTPGFQSLWFTNPNTGVTVIGISNSGTFQAYGFVNVMTLPGLGTNQ
jgi:D-alanyl-D-alanine carboxypeptidase